MQLPVRFTAGWGATAESCGASASHPRPAHPRPVQLGAVGGAAAGRWPPSAALHVSAGHALAGASCERHTWFARWIAAWYRPAACAQPPRSVSRVRRPAGLPPAPHQPQRRGRPEPASAAEDEDDAYLLAKSYFDMKARPAPPRRSPRRAPPATPPRRAALLPCCLCTPAQRQGVSRERRPWGPAERGGGGRRCTGARGPGGGRAARAVPARLRALPGRRAAARGGARGGGGAARQGRRRQRRARARPAAMPPPAPACAAPRRLSRAGPTWSAPAAAAGARCDPAASMSLCSFIHPHAQLAARCFRATSWPGRPARTAARGRQCLASQAGALRAPTVKGHAVLGCSRGRRMRGQASLLAAA